MATTGKVLDAAKKATAASTTNRKKSAACAPSRVILTPTKPSTLGRDRIRKAVTTVYGKKKVA